MFLFISIKYRVDKMKSDKDVIRSVYFSSEDRDINKYPSPANFVFDLPDTLTQIHGISISHFKFVPEKLINNINNTFTFTAIGNVTVNGSITISVGNYNNEISQLLAEINIELIPYNVHFTFDSTTKRVTGIIQNGAFGTTSFSIKDCRILQILGFGDQSINITRSVPAVAIIRPNMINDTSLILQIKDIHTISSPNEYAHRSTAVLFCSNCKDMKIEQTSKDYAELSQVQYRLQRLYITLVNMYGDDYDLTEYDASFIIHFYCQPVLLGDAHLPMIELKTKTNNIQQPLPYA